MCFPTDKLVKGAEKPGRKTVEPFLLVADHTHGRSLQQTFRPFSTGLLGFGHCKEEILKLTTGKNDKKSVITTLVII